MTAAFAVGPVVDDPNRNRGQDEYDPAVNGIRNQDERATRERQETEAAQIEGRASQTLEGTRPTGTAAWP